MEESGGIQAAAKGSLLLYYCTGTFKMVSDTNAEREKLIHTSLCYKSCRPLNDSQFILHGYLQMHSSDLLSNHITDRVRKEARKNTDQHIPHHTGPRRSKAQEKPKGSIWKVLLFIFLKYKCLSRVSNFNMIGQMHPIKRRHWLQNSKY